MTVLPTRRDRARDLERDDLVRDLARDLNRALGAGRIRDLERVLDHDRDGELDHIREFVRALDRALVGARDLALELDLRLSGGVDLDLGRARDLANDLNIARAHARVYAKGLAGDLDRAWTQATELVNVMGQPMPAAATKGESRVVVRPVRAARGLAHAASRVLPAAHRGRYREEYRSELHELAAAKAPRWRQLLYAVRLLDRAWDLRAELRAPAAEQARP